MRGSSVIRVGGAFVLVGTLATMVACSDSSTAAGVDGNRQPGVLQIDQSTTLATIGTPTGSIKWSSPPGESTTVPPSVIEVADTVAVGADVPVTVTTILSNGCWRTDGQDVAQSGMLVELTPQDVNSNAGICSMLVGWGQHSSTVKFTTAGVATIRVHGRRLIAGTDTTSEAITAERSIVVR